MQMQISEIYVGRQVPVSFMTYSAILLRCMLKCYYYFFIIDVTHLWVLATAFMNILQEQK